MSKTDLKVALVHDYLSEFGGAERVLRAFADMYPEAPIYTSFVRPGSSAAKAFADREVVEWKHAWMIRYKNLHSPLRFLVPLIWESFDFDGYDVVLSSASSYITKGILTQPGTRHVCYCHTPPRFLYGYPTARDMTKHWAVRLYASVVNPHLREYDYWAAQRVDTFVANSEEVKSRIEKFYRRNAEVIYPFVDFEKFKPIRDDSLKKQDYYFIAARLAGAKGLELALEAQKQLGFKLKIAGEKVVGDWQEQDGVEWLGRVSDEDLVRLMSNARAFLALAEHEDFGMTVVEAMACGTPVVAYAGGGYLETVVGLPKNKKTKKQKSNDFHLEVEEKELDRNVSELNHARGDDKELTGVFFEEYSSESLVEVLEGFEPEDFDGMVCRKRAELFGLARFEKEIRGVVEG